MHVISSTSGGPAPGLAAAAAAPAECPALTLAAVEAPVSGALIAPPLADAECACVYGICCCIGCRQVGRLCRARTRLRLSTCRAVGASRSFEEAKGKTRLARTKVPSPARASQALGTPHAEEGEEDTCTTNETRLSRVAHSGRPCWRQRAKMTAKKSLTKGRTGSIGKRRREASSTHGGGCRLLLVPRSFSSSLPLFLRVHAARF